MLSARNWEKTSPDDSPCGPLTRASKEITLRVSAFTMGWNAKLNSKSTPPKFGRLAAGFLLRWFGVTVFAFGAEDLSHDHPWISFKKIQGSSANLLYIFVIISCAQ